MNDSRMTESVRQLRMKLLPITLSSRLLCESVVRDLATRYTKAGIVARERSNYFICDHPNRTVDKEGVEGSFICGRTTLRPRTEMMLFGT